MANDEFMPAAPVEGLDTVGYVTTSPTGAEVFQRKPLVPGHGQFGYKQDAVVTRSQAEAIIAAKDEEIKQLKADLQSHIDGTTALVDEKIDAEFKAVTLEEKLSIATHALDAIAGYCNTPHREWRDKYPELASILEKPGVVNFGKVIDGICEYAKEKHSALSTAAKEDN